MLFDKDKVYTSVNADELKVGSKVFVADCLADLQNVVSNANEDQICTIIEILSPSNNPRFKAKSQGGGIFYWHLVYLIEEPKPSKKQQATCRELACWLAHNNGQYTTELVHIVSTNYMYTLDEENQHVPSSIRVRRWDDNEWHEATKEYLEKADE